MSRAGETVINNKCIVDAAIPLYQSFLGFVKSTDCDVAAARQTLVRDPLLLAKRAFLRNTKS